MKAVRAGVIFLSLCTLDVGDSCGVDIFRIGGSPLEAPGLWEAWTDLKEGQVGTITLIGNARARLFDVVEVGSAIQPIRPGPNVNIVSQLLQKNPGIPLFSLQDPRYRIPSYAFLIDAEQIKKMFDGDTNTNLRLGGGGRLLRFINIDLKGVYRVDKVRVIAGPQDLTLPDSLGGYTISFTDSFETGTTLDIVETIFGFRQVARAEKISPPSPERLSSDPIIEETFNSEPTRFINIDLDSEVDKALGRIAEVEVLGDDFVPHSSFLSSVIDMGEEWANWGRVRWKAEFIGEEEDRGDVRAIFRSRSGTDPDPIVYQRIESLGITPISDVTNRPLTKQEYENLPLEEKVKEADLPDDEKNWSLWSDPVSFEEGLKGTFITSPGPRRYFQFKIEVDSPAKSSVKFDFLEFEFSRPLARRITAEIFPNTAAIKKDQVFTYVVKANMDPRFDLGFDGIEIAVPDSARVNSVKVDGIQTGWRDTLILDGSELKLYVQLTEGGELGMIDESGELLEVDFESRIVKFFTRFSGQAFNSRQEVLRQTIEPGNATFDFDSDNLIVRAPTGARLIGDMRVTPNPFTPNGDGINDTADIAFTLFRLTEEVSVFSDSPTGGFRKTEIIVKMEVYDLSGRRLRTVFSKSLGGGVYDRSRDLDLSWDGRDDEGIMVSPGIYLYQVTVEADAGDEHFNGVIAVVY